jgi:hypothetical protein
MDTTKIMQELNSRDPIAEASTRMKQMSREDLTKLVLIAANKIGLVANGKDYENPEDAIKYFCMGIDMIFNTFDKVSIIMDATTKEIGNA